MACLVALLLATLALVPHASGQDFYRLKAQIAVSTVRIETATSTGLGVAIADGTILVTCNHVIKESKSPVVRTGLGDTLGLVVARNEQEDLAFVKIDINLVPIKVVKQRAPFEVGMFVMSSGMKKIPMDMDIRTGTIMAKFRGEDPNFMVSQVSERGFSGGPVIDSQGRLVGITRAMCFLGKEKGTEVIPSFKVVEFAQRASEDLSTR